MRTTQLLWLTEGRADYVGLTAADRAGVKERLKGPRGADIVPFIDNVGAPGALFTTSEPKRRRRLIRATPR